MGSGASAHNGSLCINRDVQESLVRKLIFTLPNYTEAIKEANHPVLWQVIAQGQHKDRVVAKVNVTRQVVWLGFRGTWVFDHWLTDHSRMMAAEEHPMAPKGHVQAGLSQAWNELKKQVWEWLDTVPWEPVSFHLTGHSAGAGYATLAGFDLSIKYKKARVEVIAWGSPCVGDLMFRKYWGSRENLTYLGIAHSKDYVPALPAKEVPAGRADLLVEKAQAAGPKFVPVLDPLCLEKPVKDGEAQFFRPSILDCLPLMESRHHHDFEVYEAMFDRFSSILLKISA